MLFRKAILLVHGFAGGITDYHNLSNDLELYPDFDIFSFTLPGHDKLFINDVTREDWIKEAEKQIEILINNGYRRIYVIGHSMGGVIACHLAKKYKQIKRLILIAPAFRYFKFKDDKFDLLSSIKNAPKIFKHYKPEIVISRLFKVPIATILEFMDLVTEHNDDPKDINCPTLIIQGNDDMIVSLDSSRYVHELLSSKTNILIEMNYVSHDAFNSKRYPEILKIIAKFLRYKPKKKKEIKQI